MTLDQLKPSKVLHGPMFPEPVQVIVTIPMGDSVKLVANPNSVPVEFKDESSSYG